MKKWGIIIIAVITSICLGVSFVHDFITSDPIHYFGGQPRQIIWVAVIAVVGGLMMFAYYRLSPRWQNRVNTWALGFAAACTTALTGYAAYGLMRWASRFDNSDLLFGWVALLCFGSVAGLLWFRFWQHLKKRA